MSNTIISPNMGLPIPVPGVDPGPDYANNNNASFLKIDSHTHSSGSGVPIMPSGLNINSDLPFLNNNATLLRSVRFSPQLAALSLPTDIGCIYEAGVDLYYNDGNGNQIRFTQGGALAGAAGTITGLPSGTASASYNSVSGTFIFQSATNSPANLDGESVILRNNAVNSKGLTLSPPSAMGADYTVVLPSIPASNGNFLTMDTSGNIGSSIAVDNSTLRVNSSLLEVAPLGIGTSQLADASVTQVKRAALGQQISGNSGSFLTTSSSYVNITNLSVTITTTGRPVLIFIQPVGVSTINMVGLTNQQAAIILTGTTLSNPQWLITVTNGSSNSFTTPSLSFMDTPPAGSQTYTMQARVVSATSITVQNVQLIAYEL